MLPSADEIAHAEKISYVVRDACREAADTSPIGKVFQEKADFEKADG